MKNLSKAMFILCIFNVLLFTQACQNEDALQENQSVDFDAYLKSVQSDQTYIDYINSRQTFFDRIENKEIDVFSIHNEIARNDLSDWCTIDPALLDGYKGADLFLESICEMKQDRIALFEKFENFTTISEERRIEIFKVRKSSKTSVAETRAITHDCLGLFQALWALGDAGMELYSVTGNWFDYHDAERAYSSAFYEYDKCCKLSNTTGCP